MKLQKFARTSGATIAAVTLCLGLAACGEDDDTTTTSGDTMSAEGAGAQTFGPGCSAIPTDGDGSFDGMVKDPVATAASNNPLLSTLVTAVGAIDGLGDTLNGAEALTVFAPTNDAFAEIPEETLGSLVTEGQAKGDKSALYGILAHHVIGANLDKDSVDGSQETLKMDNLTIEGNPEDGMTVSDGTVTANVLCGNIPTANATVYVIDKVLTGTK